jgi:transaldolase / glucose-6-phosphate isomerase
MNAQLNSSLSPEIAKLNRVGQSVWYDNLSRDLLHTGHLASLVDKGVSGLTSNPTIFKKAIADSSNYDAAIRERPPGLSAEELCEEVFVEDVGAAAHLLHPVFVRSRGADGYASIEVSPLLAADTEGTVQAALRLWKKLARPNIMIKVPATPEGIPAIRTLLAQGLNVNVTLIFSVAVYEQVMEAYLSALEERVSKGLPIEGIASVASFFVSRVDSIVEKEISHQGLEHRDQFLGRVGIANSKVAYARFKEVFSSDRFLALAEKGARKQRPLWASTGTKNPSFSPVLYVETLAGPDTVNTVPPATLDAILKGVNVFTSTVEADLPLARDILDHLGAAGISFDRLLLTLQEEGVELFKDSYRELLASIEEKRQTLR